MRYQAASNRKSPLRLQSLYQTCHDFHCVYALYHYSITGHLCSSTATEDACSRSS